MVTELVFWVLTVEIDAVAKVTDEKVLLFIFSNARLDRLCTIIN